MSFRALPLLLLFAALAACGSPGATDAGTDAGHYVPTESRLLGLNDATFLLPLEGLDAGSPFPAPEAIVPGDLFDRLSTQPGDVLTDLDRLRVTAVRFDVCDRLVPGPCAADAEGSLRLVLQPLLTTNETEDVSMHAFFPIPNAELGPVVDELRALARLQDVPRGAALQVNAAFTGNAEFRQRLGALVSRYAASPRIIRLTMFGQFTLRAALVWVFRGLELRNQGFVAIAIPGTAGVKQEVLLQGATSYDVTPVADAPAGFTRAVLESSFKGASPADQRASLESLAASDNPLLHTANTIQCVNCHVSTTLLEPRALDAGVALDSLSGRFTSATFDLTPLGDPDVRFRTLRALGWLRSAPLVSHRVVHETANVLEELEARYPPAP